MTSLRTLPDSLIELLTSNHIRKVGLNGNEEDIVRRFSTQFNVDIVNYENLAQFYRTKYGQSSLPFLCLEVLGYVLPHTIVHEDVNQEITVPNENEILMNTCQANLYLEEAKTLEKGQVLSSKHYQRVLLDVWHLMDRYKPSIV
jgi:hypothetical protein